MKVKEITRKCSKTNYERGTLYRVSFTDIPDYAKNMWREHSAGAHMTLTEPILEMQAVITPNKKLHDVSVGYQFNSYIEFRLEAIDTIQMANDFIKTVESEGNMLPDAYNPQTGEIMGDIEWNELVTDLKKTEQLKSISRYFQLMNDRPEEFANTGLINIEKNIDKFMVAAQVLNKPVGVVYESEYHLMVVDICIGKNGYYTYERIIPKTQGIAVAVLAEWNGRFFLLKQYRHALRDWQYAIPRGFAKDGLSGKDNAVKNVVEKTGCTVSNITYLATTVADSGLSGTKVAVYHAKCSEPDFKYGTGNATQLVSVKPEELKEMIRDGKITDGFTMTALMMYLAKKTN
ncbi:MAG: NUDIX hydrolase [Lachnospiraceae bacterium]|nr:NUDIX hydrolase [Lachnospiraceae bacterium]